MKAAFLILGIPCFIFLALSATLDLGSLVPGLPETDLTPYLAARSLACDRDLAYTSVDSDRYFREQSKRPAQFAVTKKKVITSSGDEQDSVVFYSPGLYVFALAPFVGLFRFHGVLLFHAILMGLVYFAGYRYYLQEAGSTDSALNVLAYASLVPLPILFLVPSHYLFLFSVLSLAFFLGLAGREVFCVLLLAVAASLQPWAALPAAFFVAYWQKEKRPPLQIARLILIFGAGLFVVWGINRLAFPPGAASNARWIASASSAPPTDNWDSLAKLDQQTFAAPSIQRITDFLFGRSLGLLVYAFPVVALIGAALARWKSPLQNRGLLLMLLLFLSVAFIHPSAWNARFFIDDLWIIPAAFAFFLAPMIRSLRFFVSTAAVSCLLIGPLLVNPFGALSSRVYYLQSFPYRYFPAEITLAGRAGLTANPAFQLPIPDGKFYFLDDNFYPEEDFFWTRGESSLEFLLQTDHPAPYPRIQIQSGSVDNVVVFRVGTDSETFRLAPSESAVLDLNKFASHFHSFDGRSYLHGKIETGSGFVPKLLSRESPDYRYLGCQIHVMTQPSSPK